MDLGRGGSHVAGARALLHVPGLRIRSDSSYPLAIQYIGTDPAPIEDNGKTPVDFNEHRLSLSTVKGQILN